VSEAWVAEWRGRIDEELDRLLPGEAIPPGRLHRAMRYSVFAGGKRLRPLLALSAARACGGDLAAILPAACGLEMIHTYSLIHDDLPALDDDDWRRGVPTCHRAFDEATAILAGDALLTHGLGGFAIHPEGQDFGPARLRALGAVAEAIGTSGMIGGQMDDLEAEREASESNSAAGRLEAIHARKTGRLIRASIAVGAILCSADDELLARLDRYGDRLGLAFQIKDDLLDVESTRDALGKEAGKDAARGKMTFPGVHGVASSHRILAETVSEAASIAAGIEKSPGPLAYFAAYVAERDR
jgi:geranylgeranyl diphosphate synthase, type II